MPTRTRGAEITFDDVVRLLDDTESTYGVKVRLSINPRPRTGYSEGCIALATPYKPTGAKLAEVSAEQHLWPSNGHRTINGLWMYLITRLCSSLDEWEHSRAREAQQQELEAMTPLEHYIANSF